MNKKRIRITQAEIDKARHTILSTKERGTASKPKAVHRYNDFWYGMVYCDHQGLAVIATPQDNAIILGKTDEVIKVLKEKKVDKEDPLAIIRAVQEYRTEKKTPSCHSASENMQGGITIPPQKSTRATFRNNGNFLRLLDSLIAEGYGLPTIQSELKSRGYTVPYRTLGRWVHKRKTSKREK